LLWQVSWARSALHEHSPTANLFVHLGLGLHLQDGAIVYEPAPRTSFAPFGLSVPADPSSAAFLVATAVLAEGGELLVEGVGVNPTRTGFLVVLERMGSHVERVNLRDEGGEPVADLLVRPATALRGTEVAPAEIPTLLDEIPILAVVASRAQGATVFRDGRAAREKAIARLIAGICEAVGVDAEAAAATCVRAAAARAWRPHRSSPGDVVRRTRRGAPDVRLSGSVDQPTASSVAGSSGSRQPGGQRDLHVVAIDVPAASIVDGAAVTRQLGWGI
jgi:hypothetical protein